ncbi:MAG: FAD-dependent oxidoreductase [Pseudomonadota bacterium]
MENREEHIIVVGAGIVGVSTALWLRRSGYEVTLVDRKGVASETSYGNAGILAGASVIPVTVPGIVAKAPKMLFSRNEPLFLKWSYLPKMIPFLARYLAHANLKDLNRTADGLYTLMHDTVDQHFALAKGTEAEKYIRPGVYTFGYRSEKDYQKDSLAWEVRRRLGLKDEVLGREELGKREPAVKGVYELGVACVDQGSISDPGAYINALCRAFEDEGGKFVLAGVENISVIDGRAKGIVTSSGKLDADHVVLTAGAWSGEFARKLGNKLPLEAERGYHVEFVNPNIKLNSVLMVTDKKFAINSMDGRLRSAGIVEFGGLKAGPSKAPIELLKRQTLELFPTLEYDSTNEWLGYRPSTPDSLPVIGAFSNVPNVWCGFGHQHLGLTGGPKTGRWLAQMIKGETPNVDLKPYSTSRF